MNLLWLSAINNKRYKRYNRSFHISAILASILILFFIGITTSVKLVFANIFEDNYRAKEITVYSFKWDDEFVHQYKASVDGNVIALLARNESVEQISVKYRIMDEAFALSVPSVPFLVPATIYGVDVDYSTFSKTEVLAVQEEYGMTGEPVVCGRDFNPADVRSALIDENFVYAMGIMDLNAVIGEKFGLFYDNEEAVIVEIIGVFDYRIGCFPEWDNRDYIPDPNFSELSGWVGPIIVSADVMDYFPDEVTNDVLSGQQRVIFDVKNLKDVEAVCHLIEGYTNNDMVSSLRGVKKAISVMKNISVFAFIISGVIAVFSLACVFNSIVSRMRSQRKFLKMMTVMGYTRGSVVRIYLFGHFITLLKIIITYALLIYLITFIVEYALKPHYASLSASIKNAFIIDFKIVLLYTLVFIIITSLVTALSAYVQTGKYLRGVR